MKIYRKTDFDDIMSISSVVTAMRATLRSEEPTPDVHDFWEIVYVADGEFSVTVDGELLELSCGECILYPPLALHKGAKRQHTTLDIISFESSSAILTELSGRPLAVSHKTGELFGEITSLAKESLMRPKEFNESLGGMVVKDGVAEYTLQRLRKKIELLFLDIYSEVFSRSGAVIKKYKREMCEALKDYLRMNINKSLTLNSIATALSVSTSRLKEISRETLGASPISYFIDLKLDAAKRLIRESSLTFTEISERLGFSSVHYFSKLFTKKVGMTPTEYSKTH